MRLKSLIYTERVLEHLCKLVIFQIMDRGGQHRSGGSL